MSKKWKAKDKTFLSGRAFTRSILSHLDAERDDYQPLQSIVEEGGMGKIAAYKEGNVWYSSKRAVKQYMSGRQRKR